MAAVLRQGLIRNATCVIAIGLTGQHSMVMSVVMSVRRLIESLMPSVQFAIMIVGIVFVAMKGPATAHDMSKISIRVCAGRR